ncbi:hypothetical protein JAAARDRAFT_211946 [Jaapia argillacea MUCL 33604]|uniref:C2H2-type domain-containing protein n=1 Tax=Jaapia argillacea MUCL 33604 TaxID=933084 RepID=A0A067PHS8_9AGAM|nr:hypothetical protein JAAARDRAFT_211946 [Jaapia argillacea MUCL 33604]
MSFPCPQCPRVLKSDGGRTQHLNTMHREITPPQGNDENDPEDSFTYHYHPKLTARKCNQDGAFLPNDAPPPPPPAADANINHDNPFHPFEDRIEFDFANLHFVEAQTSAGVINKSLNTWAASFRRFDASSPWKNTAELYAMIDGIQHGSAPWKVHMIRYQGPLPAGTPPKWMTETYELCMRDARLVLQNQLMTQSFKKEQNKVAYCQFNKAGKRVYSSLMSADFAWSQSDIIAKDPQTHGAMFVPIVAGSDKTTCSVATGHQEYHPVYMSPGNLTNTARRGHSNSVLPVAFLPIPKTSKKHRRKPAYQKFCRQMYHACLARVFHPLKNWMTTLEVVCCADGHFRCAIYGLGPYIADYPEQVWLCGIVQGWCPKCNAQPDNLDDPDAQRRTAAKTEYYISIFDPGVLWDDFGIRADVVPFTHGFSRADIHQLISPDLLHQVIKGTFKDHIVAWVNEYLVLAHGESGAFQIIEDIDRRIAAVPAFPGLRRFPDGRDFTQWTGDDSKALMKVYLPAITGHVPDAMVKCLAAFLDFCYIAQRNSLDSTALEELDQTLSRFHVHRQIFIDTGVREDDISLPRQHALKHYIRGIRLFGAPNGLSLRQMLRTNERMDKMAALRQVLDKKGLMEGSTLWFTERILEGYEPEPRDSEDEDDADEGEENGPVDGPKVMSFVELAHTAERGYPKRLRELAVHINQPSLIPLLRRFLYDQLYPDSGLPSSDVPLEQCPGFHGRVHVYHSAVARFYAPSDICGAGGMYRERIRSNPNWRGEYARYDTVFVETVAGVAGMQGMVVSRVKLFFAFSYDGKRYPCALVEWFQLVGDEPNEVTGMWVVKPEYLGNGRRSMAVVHLDCLARSAHLIGAYGSGFLPEDFHFSFTLDAFRSFYVNTYGDHHLHQFVF